VRARAGSVSACSLGKIKERESRQKTTARQSRNAMDAVSASSSREPVGSSPKKAAAFLAARAAGDLTDLTCPQ
jgi:hypothetical protein